MSATLLSLRIRQLALVDDLTWELGPGFTAITGETGSGKSIIVGALKLILGERADRALIRTGAESCTVEAVFEVRDPAEIDAQLEAAGVEPCQEGQLLLKRVFTAAGANRQFVNGTPTTLAVLKGLGEGLIDLHGPHDHQSLLSTETQLSLLDAFASAEPARGKYEAAWRKLQNLVAEHAGLSTDEAALEREVDLLRHQTTEIDAAELQPNEEQGLLARYTAASNGKRLVELSGKVLGRLSETDDCVLSDLGSIGKVLRDLARLDPRAEEFAAAHERGTAELQELAHTLQHYSDALDLDPASLAQLEARVSLIETLKRKYGGSVEAVLAFGADAAARLQKIESRGGELAQLEKEIAAARADLEALGKKLSKARATAAPALTKSVTGQLRDLGFQRSEFTVELHAHAEPAASGLEAAEFLFAPNPGEPAKPLRAIASSGEISRVMLAVKSSLAAQDTVSLLVFDEIDANVGGEIAHAVGAKMRSLGEAHQILCISHLPQVAASASAQFVVTKEFIKGRTESQLRPVEGQARIEEIARMLGGKTDSALAHAKELLKRK